jgi:hypothetical protein
MTIWQDNNKLPTEVQAELANYGMLRDTAKKETSELTGVKFFGLHETSDAYNIYVTDDLSKLDRQNDPMQLTVIAPEGETFDLLASKDYTKKLKLQDNKNLRRYMLNLLDSIP